MKALEYIIGRCDTDAEHHLEMPRLVDEACALTELFGNASTKYNDNSFRFARLIQVREALKRSNTSAHPWLTS